MKHRIEDWILLERLIDVVLDNVEGCVVDIGIGFSTAALYKITKRMKRKHYSCDISSRGCRWVRKDCIENIVFEGESIDFIKQFNEDKVAFVFLDGDHKYATVIEEINFFLPRLSPGGIILFHDTMLRNWGDVYGKVVSDSYLVRQEMEKRNDLQCFTWPYTALNFGLTMIMKKEVNPPAYRS